MATYNVKPSKPVAIFGALFGVAILLFGIFSGVGGNSGFVWLWVAAGVAVIAFNLWAAFSKRGATEVVQHRDER